MPRKPRRPHFKHEVRLRSEGVAWVAGVDEAGRGPLAGPVMAAAVILPPRFKHRWLNDSKKLQPEARAAIFAELTCDASIIWSCASVDACEIDRINILRASIKAMRRAVEGLARRPEHVLIDGLPVRPFPLPQTALVGGDGISLSIAAASVIAKVTRDRQMEEFEGRYPGYGFARHKGYATSEHLSILARRGPCPIHRFSFAPVAQPYLAMASCVADCAGFAD